MTPRAALFVPSRNWIGAAAMLAALWFGFQVTFLSLYQTFVTSLPYEAETAFYQGSTPAAVRWNLATFAIYTAILWSLMRATHRVGLRALIGPTSASLREFARVSLFLIPLYGILVAPSLFADEAIQQFTLTTWIGILITTLPFLFIQISAEEFVFRGYLQSHLAALSRHPILWMGVPSALFGLIHFDPTVPAYSGWAYVVWAAALGVVCADVTARSGTLGPALAIHFINNISAMLVLASDEWLYGAALFIWPTYGEPWVPWLPYDGLFLFTIWLCARLAIRR